MYYFLPTRKMSLQWNGVKQLDYKMNDISRRSQSFTQTYKYTDRASTEHSRAEVRSMGRPWRMAVLLLWRHTHLHRIVGGSGTAPSWQSDGDASPCVPTYSVCMCALLLQIDCRRSARYDCVCYGVAGSTYTYAMMFVLARPFPAPHFLPFYVSGKTPGKPG